MTTLYRTASKARTHSNNGVVVGEGLGREHTPHVGSPHTLFSCGGTLSYKLMCGNTSGGAHEMFQYQTTLRNALKSTSIQVNISTVPFRKRPAFETYHNCVIPLLCGLAV